MAIFKIQNSKLIPIKTKSFIEKNIQENIEKNLDQIFGLQFIKSEFQIRNFWIDTLAFNPQSKSFVIIEYKKDSSFSVIDQGFAYLHLMLHNQAEFIIEYNEKFGARLKRSDMDWSQALVIFIARAFTPYQVQAVGFKDLPMELWEVELYEDNLLSFNQVKSSEVKESIKSLKTKEKTILEVTEKVKQYTPEDHLKRSSKEIQTLFKKIQKSIVGLDERIQENAVMSYIAYKIRYHNFCRLWFYKDYIRIFLIIPRIDDSKKFLKKVPKNWGWAKNTWYLDLKNDKDIDYVISIIKQAYDAAPDK